MKKKPKAAKNCTVIDSAPALNPRSRKRRGSSIGSRRAQLPQHERTSGDAGGERGERQPVVPPRSGPSMIPATPAETAGEREHGADDVEPRPLGVRRARDDAQGPHEAGPARVDVEAKNDAQPKNSSNRPAPKQAEDGAAAGDPDPDADGCGRARAPGTRW